MEFNSTFSTLLRKLMSFATNYCNKKNSNGDCKSKKYVSYLSATLNVVLVRHYLVFDNTNTNFNIVHFGIWLNFNLKLQLSELE